MRKFFVRAPLASDLAHCKDIDLKVYDTALEPSAWNQPERYVSVAVDTATQRPIGYMLFTPTAGKAIEIIRLGVKVEHRNKLVATNLIAEALKFARTSGCCKLIAVVPETDVCPGKPNDVSEFLSKLGFRAILPAVPNYFTQYGDPVDGWVFGYLLKGLANEAHEAA